MCPPLLQLEDDRRVFLLRVKLVTSVALVPAQLFRDPGSFRLLAVPSPRRRAVLRVVEAVGRGKKSMEETGPLP